jgi:hypothetical protein
MLSFHLGLAGLRDAMLHFTKLRVESRAELALLLG